jgi:hypothetical protein
MDNYQFITLVIMLAGGFGWLILRMDNKFEAVHKDLTEINTRLTVVETILAMMGAPVRGLKDDKK